MVTLRTARRDKDGSLEGPEVAESEEVAELEQGSEQQAVVTGDAETAAQKQPAQELMTYTAQFESPEKRNESGEAPMTWSGPTVNNPIRNGVPQ